LLAATRQFVQKIGSAFAAVVLLVVLTGLLALLAFRTIGETTEGSIAARADTALDAERLRGWIGREMLAGRRYLDDRSPQALAMRDAARAAFEENIGSLKGQVSDAAGVQALNRVERSGRDLFLAEDRARATPPPLNELLRNELDNRFSTVERSIDDLVHQERLQAEIARREARKTLNRSQRLVGLGAGAAIVIAAGIAILLVRRLTQSFQSAQDAIRAREQFLTYASEELSRPLTSLATQIEPLRQAAHAQGSNVVPLGLSQRLEAASREVTRLSGLVNELVEASHLRVIHLNRTSVDLAKLVREVEARFERDHQEEGPAIVVQATRSSVGLWDRERLEQVIMQLLSNAVKYGHGKVVRVIVEPGDPTRLIVRDHGSGMSRDQLSHVFEAYEAGVYRHERGSLGLGLYIVRQIVEAHGGTVRAESTPTLGSTFIVELPRQPPAPRPERRFVLTRERAPSHA
jgi:signal transduction histidine kinase